MRDKTELAPLPSLDENVKLYAPHLHFFPSPEHPLKFTGPEQEPINYRRENTRLGKSTPPAYLRYVIYSLKNLNELLTQLLISKDEHRRNNSYSTNKIRFLVTKDMQLVFAKEGSPNETVPAHYQMTCAEKTSAQCLTAGNIYLIRNGNNFNIKLINHKSGDFRPSLDSMKWVLAILLANESLLPPNFIPDTLTLEEVDLSGGTKNKYLNKKTELKKDLAEHIALAGLFPQYEPNSYGPDYDKPYETTTPNKRTRLEAFNKKPNTVPERPIKTRTSSIINLWEDNTLEIMAAPNGRKKISELWASLPPNDLELGGDYSRETNASSTLDF